MPGPIDNALKQLTELSAEDWVVRGGWPSAPAALIDADIATISGATDKAIHVAGRPDWLLTVDFQAGHDTLAKLPDLLLYNSALFKRHGRLVRALLVVLHRGADSPQLAGLYERGFAGAPADVTLRYRVVRVWQLPPERWQAFCDALDAPPRDIPALRKLLTETSLFDDHGTTAGETGPARQGP